MPMNISEVSQMAREVRKTITLTDNQVHEVEQWLDQIKDLQLGGINYNAIPDTGAFPTGLKMAMADPESLRKSFLKSQASMASFIVARAFGQNYVRLNRKQKITKAYWKSLDKEDRKRVAELGYKLGDWIRLTTLMPEWDDNVRQMAESACWYVEEYNDAEEYEASTDEEPEEALEDESTDESEETVDDDEAVFLEQYEELDFSDIEPDADKDFKEYAEEQLGISTTLSLEDKKKSEFDTSAEARVEDSVARGMDKAFFIKDPSQRDSHWKACNSEVMTRIATAQTKLSTTPTRMMNSIDSYRRNVRTSYIRMLNYLMELKHDEAFILTFEFDAGCKYDAVVATTVRNIQLISEAFDSFELDDVEEEGKETVDSPVIAHMPSYAVKGREEVKGLRD